MNTASPNGIGTSRRRRSMVASTYSISSLKVRPPGRRARRSCPAWLRPATALAIASRDIAGEHRLQPRLAAADQRQHRRDRAIAAKRLKKLSLGPNTTEGRKIVACRDRGEYAAARPRLWCGHISEGECASAPIAETWIIARLRAAAASATDLGADGLHGLEALPAALEQHADEVDHHVAAAHGRRDRVPGRADWPGPLDLADPAERLQVAGEIGAAHRDPDAVSALRQRAHDMAAEKARAAEDRDQGVGIGLRCHGAFP